MDDNNLQSLLDEISFADGELNDTIDADAGVDVDTEDMDDISLEELDSLESLDLGDLDIDDIDFDDVDITSLEVGDTKASEPSRQEEDLNLDSLIREASEKQMQPAEEDAGDDVFGEAELRMRAEETDFTDVFDDAFFEQATGTHAKPEPPHTDAASETAGSAASDGMPDSDDLLARMFENSLVDGDLDEIEELSDIEAHGESEDAEKSVGKKRRKLPKDPERKKRSVSEILFGEPDADDLEEEELLKKKKEEKTAEREKKKAERAEKQEQKKAAKQEMLSVRQKQEKSKQQAKADKKRQAEEAYQAELAQSHDKRVSTPVVIVVFVLFFALAGAVLIGTKSFSYSQVIRKATDYFERQRYRLAYDQVSGVEVKEKDQDLKDRIYTVMYVERLYESYENNIKLGRTGQALDSLLRGLEKYDEHYEEAVALDIVEDVDSCRDKIINALWNTYGMTEATAYQILALEGSEYTAAISEYDTGTTPVSTPTDAQ